MGNYANLLDNVWLEDETGDMLGNLMRSHSALLFLDDDSRHHGLDCLFHGVTALATGAALHRHALHPSRGNIELVLNLRSDELLNIRSIATANTPD